MTVESINSYARDQNQSFSCFDEVNIWAHEHPTTIKILRIAGLILGVGLLAYISFAVPPLDIGRVIIMGIAGVLLILASLSSLPHAPSSDSSSSDESESSRSPSPAFSFDPPCDEGVEQTMRVMEMVRPYFHSAYTAGRTWDKITRVIHGRGYSVERANHGLPHGLRQGALAKDIFKLLLESSISDSSGIVEWAHSKHQLDHQWVQKIEMAASFQRSGRQSECNNTSQPDLYKRYEMQDTLYFREHAEQSPLFAHDFERHIFEEAILWSNPGTLDEGGIEDLNPVGYLFPS